MQLIYRVGDKNKIGDMMEKEKDCFKDRVKIHGK